MELEITGDHLLLAKDGQEVRLSAEEVSKLIVHSRKILSQLTQSPQEARYKPVASIPVEFVRAAVDAHHQSVLLLVRGEDGEDQAFVLSVDEAKVFAVDIDTAIRTVEISTASKNIQ